MLTQASRTARGTAVHRAAHQLFDRPIVFEDPLAVKVLGPEGEAWLSRAAAAHSTPASANARAFVVVRSRFAEDRLREAVVRGVRQYVLLGAGLDTFAYRNAEPDLRVFELDHPATQALKRELWASAKIPTPPAVRLEPVDLETDPATVALERAGFDFGRPAQISWLGVSIYLEPATVLGVLELLVRSLAPSSEIVFDYSGPLQELDPRRRAAFEAMARQSAALGEPYQSSFQPAELGAHLLALGASAVEMAGPKELNQRYLEGRTDGMTLGGPGHIARISL